MTKKTPPTERRYLESLVSALTGWNDPEARAERALEENEFLLFGQALVPLKEDGDLPSYIEVLIRLQEEEHNLTPPGAFLPVFEYLGMMPALDRWVIEHALQWWRSESDARNMMLSINLSADTLAVHDFPKFVEDRLRKLDVPPRVLCFELSATEVAVAAMPVDRAAKKLNALGCQFAIASFGRDSASFGALKAVQASLVKIDGGIVRQMEMHRDPVALTKIRSIQEVCRKAGIRTVAEFVEQQGTLKLLREIGVDYAQGYGVSKPGPL